MSSIHSSSKSPKSKAGAAKLPEHQALQLDAIFDGIVEQIQMKPVNQAIEEALHQVFSSPFAVLWIFDQKTKAIFSPTLSKTIETNSKCLIIEAFSHKTPQLFNHQGTNKGFSNEIDGSLLSLDDNVLFIPIPSASDFNSGMIELARPSSQIYESPDLYSASYFCSKFRLYSRFIFSPSQTTQIAASLLVSSNYQDTIAKITSILSSIFTPNSIDFFCKHTTDGKIYRLSTQKSEPELMTSLGAVAVTFSQSQPLNLRAVRLQKEFDPAIDGQGGDCLLSIPVSIESLSSWLITLRGRSAPPFFTKVDEVKLTAIAPFVIKSLLSVFPSTSDENAEAFEERLKVLLTVAETLTGTLDIDTLIPTIMEKASDFLSAERCSLFLIDKQTGELVTRFQEGLKKSLRIPLTRGIVGYTATTGNVVNIQDAYSDPRFDKSIDLATGFHTISLLTVPIINNRGEITGVTEMINKESKKSFDDDDVRMMMAFNVFCGTSLDNAKLYKASINLTRQLRTFIEMSASIGQSKTMKAVIEEVLQSARTIVTASRATVFELNGDDSSISEFVTVGEPLKFGSTFAQICVSSRTPKIFEHEEIAELTHTKGVDVLLEVAPSKLSNGGNRCIRVSSVLNSAKSVNSSFSSAQADLDSDIICCIPLLNSESAILGVMELHCNWKILPEDLELLDCFAVFTAVSIEKSQLKDVAELGHVEIEVQKWITDEERSKYDAIPARLVTNANIWGSDFDAQSWDGVGHTKVLFAIFYRFGLPQEYKICNEKLFRFFIQMRDTYKKVPYHNWRHAVDVTQFTAFQLVQSGLDKELNKFELLALLVSCVCHDANHDGFTNTFNVKAETPLGILFKNQSVMETHHAAVSIQVISKEENNIFSELEPSDFKKMWNTIIQLILSTDMARHFEVVKSANSLFDTKEFSLTKLEHRLMIMEILLKCSDISNVARPFELADKWCDVLCEEFFRQGDLEKTSGMEYTSPLNDRAHLDKPKSQIGFYTFVCLPLYETTARLIPLLKCNVDQINSNLAVWKSDPKA